jgi:single-strand DNA-binding protein
MNKIILVGRQSKDADLSYSAGKGTAILKFSMAVDRNFKNADGSKTADFFNCTWFGKGAEAVSPYMGKGKQLAVSGSMEFGNYTDKEGIKKYTQTVMVQDLQLLGSKTDTTAGNSTNNSPEDMVEILDEGDIPF